MPRPRWPRVGWRGGERARSHALALPRGALHNLVHADDHLRGLHRRQQHLLLHPERLVDAAHLHVAHLPRDHVHARRAVRVRVRRPQLCDELRGVEAGVVRDGGGNLAQRAGEALHGQRLLARRARRQLVHRLGHLDLGAASAANHTRVRHRLLQDTEGIVQGALRLVEQMIAGTAQHDGARLAHLNAREVHQLVLSDHDLLDQLAVADLHKLRMVEGRHDLSACNEG
mmetsp:Transcript_7229/g.26592  ORF Transcript_7229/g.26592 Transcript_7229/m.26592 type:complete len:228 (-) Transcript_7229:1130-1813(-)